MKLFSALRRRGQAPTGGTRAHEVDPVRLVERTPDDDLLLDALAFRALLAQVPEVLSVLTADELRWLRLSAATPGLFGMEANPDWGFGQTIEETFDPVTAHNARVDMTQVVETGEPMKNVVRELRFPTGAVGWGSISVYPIRDADGDTVAILSWNRDVTQQHWAERALETRRAQLESLLGETPSHTPGEALDAMRATCERALALTGAAGASVWLRHEDALQQEAHAGEPWTGEAETLRELADRASVSRTTVRVTRRSDEELMEIVSVPLRRGGYAPGVLQLAAPGFADGDVETAEVLAVMLASAISHQAEFAALERFRAIFDSVSTGIVRLTPEGLPVQSNPALATMLGYAHGAPRGKDFHDLVDPADRGDALELFEQLVAGEIESYELEARIHPNRPASTPEPIRCQIKATAERDAAGRPAYAILMIDDITERLHAQERLQQTQKLEGVGQLAAGIAHEFNNLLMGILGYAELLHERCTEPESLGLLEKLTAASERAATLTQQLLAYGRRQPASRRDLDLNQAVADTATMLRQVLGENIEIETELDADACEINADPGQIGQALLNLALNARDAMNGSGRLRIETGHLDVEGDSGLSVELPAGRYATLTVSDTGCGMTAAVRDRAFEPFFTTKAVGEGSGLGLSSVYGIMKQNKGGVEIVSELEEGTNVVLYFPASRATQLAASDCGPLASCISSATLRGAIPSG